MEKNLQFTAGNCREISGMISAPVRGCCWGNTNTAECLVTMLLQFVNCFRVREGRDSAETEIQVKLKYVQYISNIPNNSLMPVNFSNSLFLL